MDNRKVKIRISILDDVIKLSQSLRQDDINEVIAIGSTPLKSLLRGFVFSDECYSVFLNGNLISMFGISSYDMPKGFSSIWLLGAIGLEKIPITFVKKGIEYTNNWLQKNDILINAVDSRNIKHINWLKRIGMKFSNSIMINGYKFLQFYRIKGVK